VGAIKASADELANKTPEKRPPVRGRKDQHWLGKKIFPLYQSLPLFQPAARDHWVEQPRMHLSGHRKWIPSGASFWADPLALATLDGSMVAPKMDPS
jgi:hypothetical protein